MAQKITPREFVHLWNLILSKTLLLIKTQEYLPKVILELDNDAVVPEHIDFVVDHIRRDEKFNRIIQETVGASVSYKVNEGDNKIAITAIK